MQLLWKMVWRFRKKLKIKLLIYNPAIPLLGIYLKEAKTLIQIGMLLLLLSRFSRVRLWDPIDDSPPGSVVPGILQARTMEWVAISFSNAWKWKVKVKSLSCVDSLGPHGLQPTRLLHPWDPQARVLERGAIAVSIK